MLRIASKKENNSLCKQPHWHLFPNAHLLSLETTFSCLAWYSLKITQTSRKTKKYPYSSSVQNVSAIFLKVLTCFPSGPVGPGGPWKSKCKIELFLFLAWYVLFKKRILTIFRHSPPGPLAHWSLVILCCQALLCLLWDPVWQQRHGCPSHGSYLV